MKPPCRDAFGDAEAVLRLRDAEKNKSTRGHHQFSHLNDGAILSPSEEYKVRVRGEREGLGKRGNHRLFRPRSWQLK